MRNRTRAARTVVAVLAAAAVGAAVLLPPVTAPTDIAADPGRTVTLSLPEQTVPATAQDRPADLPAPADTPSAPAPVSPPAPVSEDVVETAAPAPAPAPVPGPSEPATTPPVVAAPAGVTAQAPAPRATEDSTQDTTRLVPPAEPPALPPAVPLVEAPAPAPAAEPAPGLVTGTLTRVWAEAVGPQGEGDNVVVARTGSDDATETAAAAAQLQVWVETDDDAFRVAPTAVVGVEDGATVTVDLAARPTADGPYPVTRLLEVAPAVLAAGAVAFGQGSTDVFGASTAVTHDVTVVLAVPRGAVKDSTTAASVASTVSGAVNTYWSQQSRNQRGVRVVATHSWQTLTRDCSDAFALWDEVAGKVGWTGGTRKHLLVYLPPSANCGAGLGTVGPGPDSGGRTWVSYNTASIIAHELGHNMGLGHSDGLLCSGRADGTFSSGSWQSGCTAYAYRDYYDVMGVSWDRMGSLAAPHADALGLLRSTEKLVTAEPVRVHLVPASADGLRVLRIDDPGGTYYVEYRVASGWDAWLSNNQRGLDAGVIVHRRAPDDPRKALLLDGSVTAGTRTDDWRSALKAGTSLTTASGVTRITVEQQSASGATIVVHRNGVAPVAVQQPTGGSQVQIRTPQATSVPAGTTVFTGVATAPEGTLLWEVVQNGTRRASGTATTGANGTFDSFQVPVALPAGTFTFRVWVPDESDGEGRVDPALLRAERTITVS